MELFVILWYKIEFLFIFHCAVSFTAFSCSLDWSINSHFLVIFSKHSVITQFFFTSTKTIYVHDFFMLWIKLIWLNVIKTTFIMIFCAKLLPTVNLHRTRRRQNWLRQTEETANIRIFVPFSMFRLFQLMFSPFHNWCFQCFFNVFRSWPWNFIFKLVELEHFHWCRLSVDFVDEIQISWTILWIF